MTEPTKSQPAETNQPRRRGRRKTSVPSVDEILQQLMELNGLVTIGAISPQQANLIQKNLKTVLDAHLKRATQAEYAPNQEELAEICRREQATVPKFIRVATQVIEERGLDADGIYRISGNLSAVQRIRCQVDQGV